MFDSAALRARLADVRDRIARAAGRAGRDPASIRLIAISKTFPADYVRAVADAGQIDFGENKVQDGLLRMEQIADLDLRWHLVGHLQSNKAARAVTLFEAIHSVDSVALAQRVARLAADSGRAPYRVYLQVNVDADPAKEGFDPEDATRHAAELGAMTGLRIEGLMTVGRLTDNAEAARPTFRVLRDLSERLRTDEPRIGPGLSMGMSDDFEVAVEEGATIVRLGRVLFGERQPA